MPISRSEIGVGEAHIPYHPQKYPQLFEFSILPDVGLS